MLENQHFLRKKILCRSAIQNVLEYRNGNGQLRSTLNVATSCTTLVKYGAVTTEKRLLIFYTFVKMLQKWAYPADYLRIRLTDLNQLVNFDRHMGGNN